MSNLEDKEDKGEIVIYNSDNGINLQVRLQNDSVWLSQKLISELYGKDVRTINEHILNIYTENELLPDATIRKFRIVQMEGNRMVSREVDFYNLEMIIAVGYRVRSLQGTAFRKWATERLKEYIVKGFAINDRRFKELGGDRHFEELLQRIRDIRSSERYFWQKILDIFATSEDYDKNAEEVRLLFKTLQNKMHFAAHGHIAPEIIFYRADASKPNMGLTNFSGDYILKRDTESAKNYLHHEELDILNRIVSTALEFAELRAMRHEPMYMRDWLVKIEELLKLTGNPVLKGAGSVSHEDAIKKAHAEYEKYKLRIASEKTELDKKFLEAIKPLEDLEKKHRPKNRKNKK